MVNIKNTVKKYYEDRYLCEYASKISSIEELEGFYILGLDESIFFPGGGGQQKDSGFISFYDDKKNKYRVEDVFEKEHSIYLKVEKSDFKPSIGDTIWQFVDRDKRFDYMHQHSAQHLLSGCFNTLFGRNTLGLHIGSEISQLDIEGEFNQDMIKDVEDLANKLIFKGVEVENYEIDRENLKSIHTRRPIPTTDEAIRILEIPNLDINACCGVHVENLSHLGIVKIKKFYRHKGNTRIEYLAGKRGYDYLIKRDRVLDEINQMYSTGEDNILNALRNEKKSLDNLYRYNKDLKELLFEKLAESLFDSNSDIKNASKDDVSSIPISKVSSDIRIMDITSSDIGDFKDEFLKYMSERGDIISVCMYNTDGKHFLKALISKSTSKKYSIDLSNDTKSIKKELNLKGGGNMVGITVFSENRHSVDKFLNYIYHIYGNN